MYAVGFIRAESDPESPTAGIYVRVDQVNVVANDSRRPRQNLVRKSGDPDRCVGARLQVSESAPQTRFLLLRPGDFRQRDELCVHDCFVAAKPNDINWIITEPKRLRRRATED